MAAYRRVDDLRSPAGWLPVHRDQLRAQRSVSSMGSLYLFTYGVLRFGLTMMSVPVVRQAREALAALAAPVVQATVLGSVVRAASQPSRTWSWLVRADQTDTWRTSAMTTSRLYLHANARLTRCILH